MGEYLSTRDSSETSVSRRELVYAAAAVAAGTALLGATAAGAKETDEGYVVLKDLLTPYAEPPLATVEQKAASPKRVLVVVDYQVDFVDGALGNDVAPTIDAAIHDRILEYRNAGDIVCYTMDTHPAENYELTREGGRVKPHCVPGTEGWEVYGTCAELLTPEDAIMVKKGTYGSMDLPTVLGKIKSQGTVITSIELAGVSTSYCVFHNAIILFNAFPECAIILDPATTTSGSEEKTTAALEQLEKFGMIINW